MIIKNSGYIPNLYPNSSRKLDQTTAVQSNTAAEDLNKTGNSTISNVDTIELSQGQTTNRASLSQTRDQLITDLNKDSDVSFLKTLQTQINSNQYNIDPKEMAKIMLVNDK